MQLPFGASDSSADLTKISNYDAFFLQKELAVDPLDSEVEQWCRGTRMQDDVKKSLAAVVNEQRKFAKSTDTTVDGQSSTTRVSPSLSSSLDLHLLKDKHSKVAVGGGPQKGNNTGNKPAAAIPLRPSSSNTVHNTNTNKFVGGFYAVKGQVASGLAHLPPGGSGLKNTDDGAETASDDNDSESTTAIIVPQFASINSGGDPVRKNSDDASGESERTVVEPYLTSKHSPPLVLVSSGSAGPANDHGLSAGIPFASLSRSLPNPNPADADDAEGNPPSHTMETVGTATLDASLDSIPDLSGVVFAAEEDMESLEAAQGDRAKSGPPHADEPRFISPHEDLNQLSDEALLSRSEFREKIDEVDRIRMRREMARKKQQLSGRATPTLPLPASSGKKGEKAGAPGGLKRVAGYHPRAAWEEPPMDRQHGSQLRNEKMFQSVLADAVHDGLNMSNMFSTSPGSNRFGGLALANFSGSRPSSRGAKDATDCKNANIKHAITQIIRTNAQYDGSFAGVLLPAGHGRSAVNRNTLRNTHISPHVDLQSGTVGASPFDASLNEARRFGSCLQVSPRTAFDDRSVSSTDSYRSHSSHYSSASGMSNIPANTPLERPAVVPIPLNMALSPLPPRKSALSMAMDAAANPVAKQPVHASPAKGPALALLNPDDLAGVPAPAPAPQPQPVSQQTATTNDVNTNADSAVLRDRSFSIPIVIVEPAASEREVSPPAGRQQSGSAPAQISVVHEQLASRSQSKEWAEDEEDELKGIF